MRRKLFTRLAIALSMWLLGGGEAAFATPAIVELSGTIIFGASSTTIMEIGGTTPGDEHDRVDVAGHLVFGGTLDVDLINGFVPAVGDSFDLFNWTTTSGAFSTLALPTLAGGRVWNPSQLYTTGVLSVTIAGDYNFDGTVDAADYVVWRKYDGTPQGYNTWRANFGHSAPGSGSALALGQPAETVVPEPASLILWLLSTGVLLASRARRG